MKTTIAVVLGSIGLIVLLAYFSQKNTETKILSYEEMSSREVALLCTTDMATEFHIHPALKIFVDSKEVFVPKNLGITDSCMHSIHTHEDTPILHVEAPVQKDFTLGDFFAVWGQSFTHEQFMEHVVKEGDILTVIVNDEMVTTFDQTILHDKDQIIITLTTKQ